MNKIMKQLGPLAETLKAADRKDPRIKEINRLLTEGLFTGTNTTDEKFNDWMRRAQEMLGSVGGEPSWTPGRGGGGVLPITPPEVSGSPFGK